MKIIGRGNLLLKATFAAMILGVLFGWMLDAAGTSAASRVMVGEGLDLVTSGFLRLIRMVIGPLVFTTLTAGVAQMGSAGSVGLIGLRTLAWFILFSFISILTGLLLVNLFEPGVGLNLQASSPITQGAAPTGLNISASAIVEEFTPTSIVDALAKNNILQIVVFSLFAGIAIGSLGERTKLVLEIIEQLASVMMKIAGSVVLLAPLAVFSALAAMVLERGVDSLALLGAFVVEFYIALGLMACWILIAGFIFLRSRVWHLVRLNREPMLVALSTSSSEAAFPVSLQAARDFGVSHKLSAFLLPISYSFNLDGSMVYLAFAVVFIAQAYGIDLSLATQIGVMLFVMLATKGAAGVPRAGLIVLATALDLFRLPAEGVVLVLAVDALMDMGRTTLNVLGNAIATAIIAKSVGELGPSTDTGELHLPGEDERAPKE